MKSLPFFIGFDPRQPISYQVATFSATCLTSLPLSITGVSSLTLPVRNGLTPFTYARFLVPWLCDFKGWALFADADVLVRTDLAQLFGFADPRAAIMVANFDTARPLTNKSLKFERAAVMLFNCEHPDNRVLTPDYINDTVRCVAPHTIDWTDNIGYFDPGWNHCVGYLAPNPDAHIVHFTAGVPFEKETSQVEYAEEWRQLSAFMMTKAPYEEIMGGSVHAKTLNGRKVPFYYEGP